MLTASCSTAELSGNAVPRPSMPAVPGEEGGRTRELPVGIEPLGPGYKAGAAPCDIEQQVLPEAIGSWPPTWGTMPTPTPGPSSALASGTPADLNSPRRRAEGSNPRHPRRAPAVFSRHAPDHPDSPSMRLSGRRRTRTPSSFRHQHRFPTGPRTTRVHLPWRRAEGSNPTAFTPRSAFEARSGPCRIYSPWFGSRDSNPDSQLQRLASCH